MSQPAEKKHKIFGLILLITAVLYFYFEFFNNKELQAQSSLPFKTTVSIKNDITETAIVLNKNLELSSQVNAKNKKELSEAEYAFCLLQQSHPSFEVHYLNSFFYDITTIKSDLYKNTQEWFFAVKNNGCPQDSFSIARVYVTEHALELKIEKSCHDLDRALDRLLEFREQFNIVDKPNEGVHRNLSIHGQGYFLLNCNGEFYLTRVGSFNVDRSGYLSDAKGCLVMNSQLKSFYWGKATTQKGRSTCFSSDREKQECIAIVDPKKIYVRKGYVLNSVRIHLEDVSGLEFSLDDHASIYNHTLEEIIPGPQFGGISKKSFLQLSENPDCSNFSLKLNFKR